MRRKIIGSLLLLFLFSSIGSAFTILYIKNTTSSLERLITLHQINDLRQHLIISVQTVQSDLYTVRTSLGQRLDLIADNVTKLDTASQKCSTCHHEPDIAREIEKIQSLVADYERALSYYITASANVDMINRMKLDVAAIGHGLLVKTERMSVRASNKLESSTHDAMHKIQAAWIILSLTLMFTFFLGIVVAVTLTRSLTSPITTLVRATRAIAGGNLGYAITLKDEAEFGELARNFNAMSISLKDGYEKLQAEISERKQTEEALRESEERYALAACGANDGLWDWDLRNNKVHFSYRWKSMLGYGEQEIGEQSEEWFGRIHPDDRMQVEARMGTHLSGHSSQFESEYRILHKDGGYRWVLSRGLAVRDEGGYAYRIAGSQTDITARKTAEEQLLHDAFHDALTGLPNRALFLDRLQHVLESSQRQADYLYAVLFLDMDRFKVINDSLGHSMGDMLLNAIGQRLDACLRPGDTVARFGGDEFAVLVENIKQPTDAADIAERINSELSRPFIIDGHEMFTSTSIGIAMRSEHYERPEQILRDADIAMYQAKAKGTARYEIFEASMHANIIDHLELEADLRGAVDHRQFVLHYQPIIDLKSRSLIGFESLVRWEHPRRGTIYPLDFIRLTEEMGIIGTLGDWIIMESCRQLKKWQKKYPMNPPLRMSVNISSKQFAQPDLVKRMGTIIRETEIAADSLTLEITESMIMENMDNAVATMTSLRDMGVHIHIDDFGTGYSSLSYLHRLPVNALKIDSSFVGKISASGDNMEIVSSIISLARSLNLSVIAEGVEHDFQLARIRDLDCLYAQGYFFSEPLLPGTIETWMDGGCRDPGPGRDGA